MRKRLFGKWAVEAWIVALLLIGTLFLLLVKAGQLEEQGREATRRAQDARSKWLRENR